MSDQEWSLNEVEAITRKATRGIGQSWGIAEEAGRAARWLSERGLPGARIVATLLSRTDGADPGDLSPRMGTIWRARGGSLCPLLTGTALSDQGLTGDGLRTGPMICPALLLPFAAALGVPLTLSWGKAQAGIDGARLYLGPQDAAVLVGDCASVNIGQGLPPGLGERARTARQPVSQGTRAILNALAERTFAPATDASRTAGAGGTES